MKARLNEAAVAGSGYGDCVAALIADGERRPRVDSRKATAWCVRACPQGARHPALSMAKSGQAGDSALSAMQRPAWRLTPRVRRTIGGVQDGRFERPLLIAAGKKPMLRPGEPPIGAQDLQELRREHDVAVLAALALLDPDHHPPAINVAWRSPTVGSWPYTATPPPSSR